MCRKWCASWEVTGYLLMIMLSTMCFNLRKSSDQKKLLRNIYYYFPCIFPVLVLLSFIFVRNSVMLPVVTSVDFKCSHSTIASIWIWLVKGCSQQQWTKRSLAELIPHPCAALHHISFGILCALLIYVLYFTTIMLCLRIPFFTYKMSGFEK